MCTCYVRDQHVTTIVQEQERSREKQFDLIARRAKKAQQNMIIEGLRHKYGKPKKTSPEYVALARLVYEAAHRDEITGKQGAELISMDKSTFSRHVKSISRGKSLYGGPQAGRPVGLTDADLTVVLRKVIEGRNTRNSVSPQGMKDTLATLQFDSMKRRGCAESREMSATTARKVLKKCGIGNRKCQHDNLARKAATASPRNIISNFSGLFGLCDSSLTHDGKDVAAEMKVNIDAVSTYLTNENGVSQVVTRKSSLLSEDPELLAAFKSSLKVPVTAAAEGSLYQVCFFI
jgi:hypothetical protein